MHSLEGKFDKMEVSFRDIFHIFQPKGSEIANPFTPGCKC